MASDVHGVTTDGFPNLFLIGGNQHTVGRGQCRPLARRTGVACGHIIQEVAKRQVDAIEPIDPRAVDTYTEIIRTAPANKVLVNFYASCTPATTTQKAKPPKAPTSSLATGMATAPWRSTRCSRTGVMRGSCRA